MRRYCINAFWKLVLIFALFATKWKFSRGEFSLEDFFSGPIFKYEVKDTISPFGENNGAFDRDYSLNCTCGLSKLGHYWDPDLWSTIQLKSPRQVPWMVLIHISSESNTSSVKICSGSIINDLVILTTASCLTNISSTESSGEFGYPFDTQDFVPDKSNVDVIIATENATEIDLSNHATFRKLEVEDLIVNPYFIYQRIFYKKTDWDIGFIYLKNRLIFNDDTEFVPVCLPSLFYTHKELEGVGTVSLGWTKAIEKDQMHMSELTSYSLSVSKVLYVHPKHRCQAITMTAWISERHFCTNGPLIVESKYIETLGAPVMIYSEEPPYIFTQYGTVSWDVNGFASKKKNVRVATNLSGFLQSIENFSDSVGAQWCSVDYGDEDPAVDWDWDDGQELNKPMDFASVPRSQWESLTSEYRKLLDESTCICGERGKTLHKLWKASIIIKNKNHTRICPGSLINDKVVLASAVCLLSAYNSSNMNKLKLRTMLRNLEVEKSVQASDMEVHVNSNAKSPEIFGVESLILHPNFNKTDVCSAAQYDLASVVLKTPIDYLKKKGMLSPICLPSTGRRGPVQKSEGHYAIITSSDFNAWGTINFQEFRKQTCRNIWANGTLNHHTYLDIPVDCGEWSRSFNDRLCGGFETGAGGLNSLHFKQAASFLVSTFKKENSERLKLVGFESEFLRRIIKPAIVKRSELESIDVEIKAEEVIVHAYNEMRRKHASF